jgi:GNAT superfamily N-acetyltransferase
VAVVGSTVVGFVTVHDDELEQLYVAERARGRGVAVALIRCGEARIAERFALAWLAVAVGNARARRFYAREGWSDAGAFDYPAAIEGGTVLVPCHRYEKHVSR